MSFRITSGAQSLMTHSMPFTSIPALGVRWGGKGSFMLYQVPVDAAEERVRLDIGKSGLWPAAEPLFGVLGVRVQIRTYRHAAKKPQVTAGGKPAFLPSVIARASSNPLQAVLTSQVMSRHSLHSKFSPHVGFIKFLSGIISHPYVLASRTKN